MSYISRDSYYFFTTPDMGCFEIFPQNAVLKYRMLYPNIYNGKDKKIISSKNSSGHEGIMLESKRMYVNVNVKKKTNKANPIGKARIRKNGRAVDVTRIFT